MWNKSILKNSENFTQIFATTKKVYSIWKKTSAILPIGLLINFFFKWNFEHFQFYEKITGINVSTENVLPLKIPNRTKCLGHKGKSLTENSTVCDGKRRICK